MVNRLLIRVSGRHTGNGKITKIKGPNCVAIVNISNPAVVTTSKEHGFTEGDEVMFFGVSGVQDPFNQLKYVVEQTTPLTFQLRNTSLNVTVPNSFVGPSGFVVRVTSKLLSIQTTHDNDDISVSKGLSVHGGKIALDKASEGTSIVLRAGEDKGLHMGTQAVKNVFVDSRNGNCPHAEGGRGNVGVDDAKCNRVGISGWWFGNGRWQISS